MAEAGVEAAEAERRPDWGWDVTYQRRDRMWGDMVSAGVTVSLPLFASKRQTPQIEARSRQVTRARLDQDAAYRQLDAQLTGDLADHTMRQDRLVRAQSVLLPLAQKKADLETASYGAGTASLGDVLQSNVALAEARIEALSREGDVVRSAVQIQFAYGSGVQ
jgi:cobalt-zinc-cadmium efflux system outer membrane protein